MAALAPAQRLVNSLWAAGFFLAGLGKRATSANLGPPRDPVLARWFGADSATAAGIAVDAEAALRHATFYTCVNILAETVAQLPLVVYRHLEGGGKERDRSHPLWDVLHLGANRLQSSFEWREMMVEHLCVRGIHYAEIVSGNDGRVRELLPLNPDRTRPFRAPDGSVAVEHWSGDGARRVLLASEVLRIPFKSSDGIRPLSPVARHRETLGLAIAAHEYGARFFGNSAQPRGVLQIDSTLGEAEKAQTIKDWNERVKGVRRAHGTVVLEPGIEWKAVGLSNTDAEFINTRKLSKSDIFGLLRIPPHMGGDLERATFSNIEHQALSFVMHTVMPWLRRIEDRLNLTLLSAAERQTHSIGFIVDGLLRGDFKTRTQGYALGRMWGWWSINDIRGMDNLPGIGPDGDIYLQPTNMVDIAQATAMLMGDPIGNVGDNTGGGNGA